MRRFGLIGYPLTHSFSQKYFTEKFAQLGITNCVYDNYAIKDISELDAILKQPDLCGLNVTIPYKKQVIPFLTQASYAVNDMGACNCIDIKNGSLTGHNTDISGFEKSLLPHLHSYHNKALVLGTGGASAAVIYALNRLQIEPQYVSRNAGEGLLTYQDLNEDVLAEHLLIVNTSPVGMYPDVDGFPDIPYEYLTDRHHVYDLVYNPPESAFLAKAKAKGATTQNGMEMLILQAEESWQIWND